MMKTAYATNLAAATLLVVPALTLGTDAGAGLRSALSDTVRALNALVGLSEDVGGGKDGAMDRVRALTESPILDDQTRDQYLVQLRREVGQLRMQDELGIATATSPPGTVSPGAAGGPAWAVEASDAAAGDQTGSPQQTNNASLPSAPSRTTLAEQHPASVTTGLDDRMRMTLTGKPTASATAGKREGKAMEAEGFSADPMLEAQANYRAEHYDNALALLSSCPPGLESSWWRGRCLEKLGRLAEALAIYEGLAQAELTETASEQERVIHARVLPRVQRDVDFLRWAVEFRKSITHHDRETAGK